MGRSHYLDEEESAMALPRSGIFFEDLGLQTSHKSNDIAEKLFFPSLLALFERFLISDTKGTQRWQRQRLRPEGSLGGISILAPAISY
jgi:hypothetical protein